MNLTPEVKSQIDSMSYTAMLSRWRFAAVGDPMFQGERGDYFAKRMKELREQPGGQEQHVSASKSISW